MARSGSGITLNYSNKSSCPTFHIMDIRADYPEESYLRRSIEAMMSGKRSELEEIKQELEISENADKLAKDIENAGEGFQSWLKGFKDSGVDTLGIL